jgi:hypothetical protein
MKTKCKECLYLSEDKQCEHDIHSLISNKIDYDQQAYPEINEYRCLYAFPKNFSTHQELKDSTLDQLEEFRLSKIPKIKTSIIVDGFKQSYEEIYKTIESLMPILNNDNQNIVSTDLCVLLCSEQKDKLKFVEYLENNIKIKWKCSSMKLCLNLSHKFLFSLQHIDQKSKMILYVKAGHDPIKTQRVIDETVNVSIIEQRPYVFLHNDSLDLVDQFDCFSCNLINFNTLKRHNTSDTDTQADKNLIYEWVSRENKPELIINVNK